MISRRRNRNRKRKSKVIKLKLNYSCVRDVLLTLKKLFTDEQENTESLSSQTTGEIQNTAQIDSGKNLGDYDLVRMTEHNCTCGICAKYQGRVYALTKQAANGKYKAPDGTPLKFPYLYETAFANGRNEIHPSCRHRISIFPARAYKKEELLKFSQKSMRPFEDERSDEEKFLYDAIQANKKIQREQRKLYEDIRKVLPDDVPKSFSGFVKMDTAKSTKYQLLMKNYQEKSEITFNKRISFQTLVDKMRNKNYTSEDILYSLKKLGKERFIQTDLPSERNTIKSCVISSITYEGRKFIYVVESEIIWKKIISDFTSTNVDIDLSSIYKTATDIIKKSINDFKGGSLSQQQSETSSTSIIESKQEPSVVKTSSISSDWNISISFGRSSSQNFDRALFLAKQAPKYDEHEYNGKTIYQATYGKNEEQYLAFIQLYEMIQSWKSTTVFINGKMIDRKIIGGLNYCYGDKCRSGNPDFCYGASFMTKNPFGCHRLQVSACNHPWWSFSEQSGNYYYINKDEIKQRIDSYSKSYKMCPCFDETKVYKTLEDLPSRINTDKYDELCGKRSLIYSVNVNTNSQPASPLQSSLPPASTSSTSNKERNNIKQQANLTTKAAGGCLLPVISIIGGIVLCLCLLL